MKHVDLMIPELYLYTKYLVYVQKDAKSSEKNLEKANCILTK
ncbi:hypothetical protein QCI42_14005 [Bacillus fungorum]